MGWPGSVNLHCLAYGEKRDSKFQLWNMPSCWSQWWERLLFTLPRSQGGTSECSDGDEAMERSWPASWIKGSIVMVSIRVLAAVDWGFLWRRLGESGGEGHLCQLWLRRNVSIESQKQPSEAKKEIRSGLRSSIHTVSVLVNGNISVFAEFWRLFEAGNSWF